MDPAETEPERSSGHDDSASPKRRPWRRRIIVAGLALFALSLTVMFTAPMFLEPYVIRQVNESLRELLDAEGEVESIELSALSGVSAGPARFRSRDGTLELIWRALRSDASFVGALTDDHWNLGQRLEVDGLLLRCALPEKFQWPESWPDALPIVLPALVLTDATVIFERKGLRILLRDIRVRNDSTRLTLFGDDSLATDLTTATELFISAQVQAVVQGKPIEGRVGFSLRLIPGTAHSPCSPATASFELSSLRGDIQAPAWAQSASGRI